MPPNEEVWFYLPEDVLREVSFWWGIARNEVTEWHVAIFDVVHTEAILTGNLHITVLAALKGGP